MYNPCVCVSGKRVLTLFNMHIFILDALHAHHCKVFIEEDGFDHIEKYVNKEIERHQHLASKIKGNVDAWKDQRRQNFLGKAVNPNTR